MPDLRRRGHPRFGRGRGNARARISGDVYFHRAVRDGLALAVRGRQLANRQRIPSAVRGGGGGRKRRVRGASGKRRGARRGASRPSPLEALIDRVSVTGAAEAERVREALEKSFYLGGGRARVVLAERRDGIIVEVDAIALDRRFNCSRCGTPFPEPSPALFSSNSPIGACPECEGFGRTVELDLEKVIPNPNLSMRQGLIAPWRTPAYREMSEWMLKLARKRKIRTAVSFREMTDEERVWLVEGEPRPAAGGGENGQLR